MPPYKRGQKSKLEKIPERQREALIQWLTTEAYTYKRASAALKERFGVIAGNANLSAFYHRHCVPRLAKNPQPDPVLLDVILKRRKDGSLQVRVLNCASGLALHGHQNLKTLVRRGGR